MSYIRIEVRGRRIPEDYTPWGGDDDLPDGVDKDDQIDMITADGRIYRKPAWALTWRWADDVHTGQDVIAYKKISQNLASGNAADH